MKCSACWVAAADAIYELQMRISNGYALVYQPSQAAQKYLLNLRD